MNEAFTAETESAIFPYPKGSFDKGVIGAKGKLSPSVRWSTIDKMNAAE
jgi:hypothetical protein